MTKNQNEDEVPVEQDKSYEELVDPDITGEPGNTNLGEFGPDTTDPGYTNKVNPENDINEN